MEKKIATTVEDLALGEWQRNRERARGATLGYRFSYIRSLLTTTGHSITAS